MLSKDKTIDKGYRLILKRLARRDYTRLEISEYLQSKMEIDKDEIEEILEILEKQRFVDDGRYAEERISYLRYQLRGDEWIKKDLIKRGIDENDLEVFLNAEDEDEKIARAMKRSEQFLNRTKDGSKPERMNKLKSHLIRQGYPFDIINKVLNVLEDNYDKEDELESLRKVMSKSHARLSRRFEGYELNMKVINHARSKGYPFEMIKMVMEELDECKD